MTSPPEQEPKPTGRRQPGTMGASLRDMVISMLILLPIVGLVALIGRGCSFSPGGPTSDPSQLPSVDPHPTLVALARQLGFPLREPNTPPGWRTTAVNLAKAPGGGNLVRLNWITAGDRYVKLVQSRADEGALVESEVNSPPAGAVPIQAAGAPWVDYTAANGEHAWARRVDGVEWLITGDASPSEFTELAQAVSTARPLPTT